MSEDFESQGEELEKDPEALAILESIQNKLDSKKIKMESQSRRDDPLGAYDWMDRIGGKFESEEDLEEIMNIIQMQRENFDRHNRKYNDLSGKDLCDWFYGGQLYEHYLGWSGALNIMEAMSVKDGRVMHKGFEFSEVNEICAGSAAGSVDDPGLDLSKVGTEFEDLDSFKPNLNSGIWNVLWDYEHLNYILAHQSGDSGETEVLEVVVNRLYEYLDDLNEFIENAHEDGEYNKYVALNLVRDAIFQAIYGMDIKYGHSLASEVLAMQAEHDKMEANFDMNAYTEDVAMILAAYAAGNNNILFLHNIFHKTLVDDSMNVDQKIEKIDDVLGDEMIYQYIGEGAYKASDVDRQTIKLYLQVLSAWMGQVGMKNRLVSRVTKIGEDVTSKTISMPDLEEGEDEFEDFTKQIGEELDQCVQKYPELQEVNEKVMEVMDDDFLTSKEKVEKIAGMEDEFFKLQEEIGRDSDAYQEYAEILFVRWMKRVMPEIDI